MPFVWNVFKSHRYGQVITVDDPWGYGNPWGYGTPDESLGAHFTSRTPDILREMLHTTTRRS